MKITDIIKEIDECKPNGYSEQQKLRWIAQLDGQIASEIMLMAPEQVQQVCNYPYPKGLEVEPLVSFPFDDIYRQWLTTMIDYTDGEMTKYNGSLTMFEFTYNKYATWFLNKYDPAQR